MEFGKNNIESKQLFKISFCIPTYNRAQILAQCLESIVTQPNFKELAEIVISDNASTDNTAEIAEHYQRLFPQNIIYNRNNNNIGMEANFLKALELGSGKLLKLLNDYAILEPKALNHYVNVIAANENEEAILFFRNKPKKNNESRLYAKFDSFLREVTYWTTWIGTFSIWRNDFQSIEEKEKYTGLLFVHMLLLFENFREKKKLLVNFLKLTSNNPNINYKSGYNFYEIFIKNYIGAILGELYKNNEINCSTYRKIKSDFCTHFLFYELYYIKNNKNSSLTFSSDESNKLNKYFKFYPEFYLSYIYVNVKLFVKNKISMK